jgi:hypothetical protein
MNSFKLKFQVKNLGKQRYVKGFNSGVIGLKLSSQMYVYSLLKFLLTLDKEAIIRFQP